MPKISVIIPVYNVEKYLCECLDSVINQTLQDIEIICINDGSTDNSLEILKKYAKNDNRIVIIDKKNEGAGEARNKGLDKASGEYLAFLDGDDFYNLDYLEKIYAKAKLTNADIVVCAANSFNDGTKETKPMSWSLRMDLIPQKEIFNYKDFSNYIFNCFQNWNWNKLYKNNFVKSNNIYFQKLYRTNDLYFTCVALVLAERISVLNENLVNYRIGMTQNSQSTNHLYPFDFYKAFKKLREFLINADIYQDVELSYMNHAVSGCIYNAKSIKDEQERVKLEKVIAIKAGKDLGLSNLNENNVYNRDLLCSYQILQNKYKFNIFKMLFSIQNTDDKTHKILTILGIKIKFRRRVRNAEG